MKENWLGKMIGEYDHPSVVLWRAIELKMIARLFKKHHLSLCHPVLDLGCGEGKIAKALFGKGRIEYGLDNCPKTAELAKASGVYKKVVVGDARQLPFKDRTMGFVFSNCVVEHIPGVDQVLAETSRVLKKDGLFLFTVPSPNFSTNLSLTKIFRLLGWRTLAKKYSHFRNQKLNHYNCFGVSKWERELKAQNLKIKYWQSYISPTTLFVWDICAMVVFPLTFLINLLKVKIKMFPLKSFVFTRLFTRFYKERDDERGAAFLLVAKKI